MLYKHNQTENLEDSLFQNPSSEYRGAPFWAWNCVLDEEQLMRQIGYLQEMGFGGFNMHCRTGMATEYLSQEFFQLVRDCTREAQKRGMLAWTYDEDRWPSGAAGGLVTKEKKFRARHLLFTPFLKETNENRKLLGAYNVVLDGEGYLARYARVAGEEAAAVKPRKVVFAAENVTAGYETKERWYAYLELSEETPWHNNQTYVDTLNKKAIEQFCRITHERYYEAVGDHFGRTVPAIFTDEPQFTSKKTLAYAKEKADVSLPWTDDLEETFREAYGEDLMGGVPELFWDRADGKPSVLRYHYHAHISDRFAESFAHTLGQWCEGHGLMLTGHMMEEPTLKSQTAALGEVMRSLSYFQLPGIDMLCDRREYTTAKQAQSVSHQYGREGVLSELYGVTGWDFDFRGHKLQGDWQAALGVTVRTPHLSWVSMNGEAKRDYPASINYQAPWYKRYSLIEDHFARVNTAMTRGKCRTRIAVLHPVESYWLHWGVAQQTAGVRRQLDENFEKITRWLLFGQLDFDYLSEGLLKEQCGNPSAPLEVGPMQYEAVVVPGCETIRESTYEVLKAFGEAGGRLIFMGEYPKYIEARKDSRLDIFRRYPLAAFSQPEILELLEEERDLSIFDGMGEPADGLLYQLREDGENRYLFIAHGRAPRASEDDGVNSARDMVPREKIRIYIKGEWRPTVMDTMTGGQKPIARSYENGSTVVEYSWYGHDSLLLKLEPGRAESEGAVLAEPFEPLRIGRKAAFREDFPGTFYEEAEYRLEEPNVCVLDMPEYALDSGDWEGREEVLRVDNLIRKRLGLPPRQDAVAQPWVTGTEKPAHTVRLRYRVRSSVSRKDVWLALEELEHTRITWNGKAVGGNSCGYYVDECIQKVCLGGLQEGENILELEIAFGKQTNLENCFLLGYFGVKVQGARVFLEDLPEKLTFGSLVTQGLPFYGGNIIYELKARTSRGKKLKVHVPMYRGALIDVEVDGGPAGSVVFAPYTVTVDKLPSGPHRVSLKLYGSRVNTFGALHNCNEHWWWHGPDDWRTYGDEWSYEYQLKDTGILKSPDIYEED